MTLTASVTELVQPENEFENNLIEWVVTYDEYRLADRRFDPTDVVIDVGAHIGVFSAMCHVLGSRSIRAFEPDGSTGPRLVALAKRLPGLEADGRAVFRSDVGSSARLWSSGGIDDNTGSSNVLFGGRTFDVDEQIVGRSAHPEAGDLPVEVVSLDEILESMPRVSLLKVDCEGSEYPILLTSSLLAKVDEIVGEYHLIEAHAMQRMVPSARLGTLTTYSPGLLVVHLEAAGFEVTLHPSNPRIGLFRAVRRSATVG